VVAAWRGMPARPAGVAWPLAASSAVPARRRLSRDVAFAFIRTSLRSHHVPPENRSRGERRGPPEGKQLSAWRTPGRLPLRPHQQDRSAVAGSGDAPTRAAQTSLSAVKRQQNARRLNARERTTLSATAFTQWRKRPGAAVRQHAQHLCRVTAEIKRQSMSNASIRTFARRSRDADEEPRCKTTGKHHRHQVEGRE